MKFILSLMLSFSAFAGSDHMHPSKVSPNFEKLKALVGTWEGKSKMHGKDENVKVTYELTSGGTALVEKLGPGTPMEMVTVYANRGNDINATHYCAMGNQPEMKLKSVKGNTFNFEMDGTQGISDKNESHMHAVSITVDGKKLKQEWQNYKDGKKSEAVVLEYKKI